MVYLLAPHASVIQTNTMKFKQDFIGPLFIDTALDKTHYRLKDTTGLLLDGTYHMNHIKKGSARTPLGICHAWQRRPPFPVNLHDLASLQPEGMQAKYSGRCTLLEYPLLDWYGPFGSSPPSHWYGRGLD